MPRPIKTINVGGCVMHYRLRSNDLNVIREVITGKTYYRPSIEFKVELGETWLDLGAHIGSFAAYANSRGAFVECYEPDISCFSLLKKNVIDGVCINTAVTTNLQSEIDFWCSTTSKVTSRGTYLDQTHNFKSKYFGVVQNTHIDHVLNDIYDGVKMDIEGAEFSIIDEGKLPQCEKLCLEYHTSRDPILNNFKLRLDKLRDIFEVVSYRKSIDVMIEKGGRVPKNMANLDRVIYCMGRKNPQ